MQLERHLSNLLMLSRGRASPSLSAAWRRACFLAWEGVSLKDDLADAMWIGLNGGYRLTLKCLIEFFSIKHPIIETALGGAGACGCAKTGDALALMR